MCTRGTKPVISAIATHGDGAGRDHSLDGLASVGSTTVHYRGWAIDVLSYRVEGGWRPFIVIHGPDKAVVPDAATLWDPVPAKAEADEYAVGQAREWIDKRF